MQFEFRFETTRPADAPIAGRGFVPLCQEGRGSTRQSEAGKRDWLQVGARRIPLQTVRHRRARRYVLRLNRDGAARVTIPRSGSIAEAKRFATRNISWLEKQLLRQASHPPGAKPWRLGTEILFRGENVRIEVGVAPNIIRFGSESARVSELAGDFRPAIERHLWRVASRELATRVTELATTHGFVVNRVTIRNQRSRWGSCSRKATISLNWRLIQAPPFVCDYIILHELAHLKEMNHSRRFWREVARLCPGFADAERWLKKKSELLA